jgi:hypothetical protein
MPVPLLLMNRTRERDRGFCDGVTCQEYVPTGRARGWCVHYALPTGELSGNELKYGVNLHATLIRSTV